MGCKLEAPRGGLLRVDEELARRSPAAISARIVIARCLNGHSYVLERTDLRIAPPERPSLPGRPCRICSQPIEIRGPWDSLRRYHAACLAEARRTNQERYAQRKKARFAKVSVRDKSGRFLLGNKEAAKE